MLGSPIGGWPPEDPAGIAADELLDTKLAAAQAEYNAAVKAARITHASQIGEAQVARVTSLGGALITEATEAASAEVAYVGNQNGDEAAYVQTVTTVTTAAVAALASSAEEDKSSNRARGLSPLWHASPTCGDPQTASRVTTRERDRGSRA